MLKRFAIAVFVLAPLAASAQAQTVPLRAPTAGGIAVFGRGAVRVPVKTLRFVAFARGPADDAAVLAAMRAAGIEDAAIGPSGSQLYLNNGAPTTVRGTIRDVSDAKLKRVALAAADYVRTHPGTTIDNIGFSPRLDDCAQLEQTARVAAFADARRRAIAVAAAAGVGLGEVMNVSENGGCPSDSDLANPGPQQPLDLATLTTTVSVFENVTFAIAVDGSRRRTL
jgi:uncharacterized protein